jgi:tetratricopeptide (TPR) repeat protein
MPKRDVKIIAHSSLTQHRIVRKPGQPYPGGAAPPASGDLVYVNGAQSEFASLPAVTRLQAYAEIARKRPEYVSRYLALLEHLSRTDPDHPFVQAGLARREMLRGAAEANERAAAHLSRAVELGVNAPGPYLDLSEVFVRLGQLQEAVSTLRQAVDVFPYSIDLRKALAIRLKDAGRYAEAVETLRQATELFPENAELREILREEKIVNPSP